MIWAGGRLVADEALSVSVSDRTFQHGLGLFETLRTWGGRAPLLDRHLARLTRSAGALGLPIDRAALPDAGAVSALLAARDVGGDALLRITLTGGLTEASGSTLWMRAAPLPARLEKPGAEVGLGRWRVDRDDPLARFKSLNYWGRRLAYEEGRTRGFDEVASRTGDGCLWEGSFTNLFAVIDGGLVTPTLEGPIVPGVMRGLVLELARALSLPIGEPPGLAPAALQAAEEVFLTNSVRGIIPVARVGDFARDSPGPTCRRLGAVVSEWLTAGGRS